MNKSMIRYVLGWILAVEALFMIFPMLVALYYREKCGLAFLVTAVIAGGIGALLQLKKPEKTTLYARDGFVIVALSWIVLSLVGAVPFCISKEIPNYLDAVFETVSGFTTTGASILTEVEALSKCMLFWRCFTNWVGGMGILVFVLSFLSSKGGSGQTIYLLRAESPGPTVSKMVPKMQDTARILYSMYIALGTVQFVLYIISGMPIFDSLCLALATSGTGGFAVLNDSLAGYTVFQQAITTVFMILFGVNFSIYFLLLKKDWKSVRENTEIRWYFSLMIIAMLVIAANTYFTGGFFKSFGEAFHHSAFSVMTCMSTCGFATKDFDKWPELSKMILVAMMFVGGCAGSTGGGIKVSRIVMLIKSAFAEVRHALRPHSVQGVIMDGKKVPSETAKGVCVYFIIYAGIMAASILFVSIDDFDFTTTVTSVIATLNNIGPGLGMVGPTGNFSMYSPFVKIVLTLDMLIGRLELMPMLILFMPGTWRKH